MNENAKAQLQTVKYLDKFSKNGKGCHHLTQNFSIEHRYGISSQLYRAAVSIPSNIAEGSARKSEKEFYQFLHVSLSSAFELETQLTIAKQCGLCVNFDYQTILDDFRLLQKQIVTFSNTIISST